MYRCKNCRSTQPTNTGACRACRRWDVLIWETPRPAPRPVPTAVVVAEPEEPEETAVRRISTGSIEMDRVLGSGGVLGSVVLFSGDPGVGKSTLLMQTSIRIAEPARPEVDPVRVELAGTETEGVVPETPPIVTPAESSYGVLYVSGEESRQQVLDRATRLGLKNKASLHVLGKSNFDDIHDVAKEVRARQPDLLIVDSINTVYCPEATGKPGSVAQISEATRVFSKLAEEVKALVFLVGHMNKNDQIAGPKALEHLVDVVLMFEGERGYPFRTLRSSKNRHGSTLDVGVFEMGNSGLKEVKDPSRALLAGRTKGLCGSVIASALGAAGSSAMASKSMLVEIQAVIGMQSMRSMRGSGKKTAIGIDQKRLCVLIDVLESVVGYPVGAHNVTVQAIGGLSLHEPALDLPILLAIASKLYDRVFPSEMIAFGEVSVAGEVRMVPQATLRCYEAVAMGFSGAILPEASLAGVDEEVKNLIGLFPVVDVAGAIEVALNMSVDEEEPMRRRKRRKRSADAEAD